MNSTGPILFYSVTEEFGEFSNFAPYPITIGRKVWPTSEHYFQARKFLESSQVSKIRKTKSPMEAARLGRARKAPIRKDWEKIKGSIMQQAVMAKFTQHPELRALLLSTGERKIVEHTTNDDYWGDGGDGTGENMLGRILMDVRNQLREK